MPVPICQGTQKPRDRWSNRLEDTNQVCGQSENHAGPPDSSPVSWLQAKPSLHFSQTFIYFKTISFLFFFLFKIPNKSLPSAEKRRGGGSGIKLDSDYATKYRPSGPIYVLEERGWETSLNGQGSKCRGRKLHWRLQLYISIKINTSSKV